MSAQSPSSHRVSFASGPLTAFVLFVVVAVCIGLIGLSGYVKYQLDQIQASLAAPELQLTPEQQAFDKIRRELGYSGFLGLAQNFAASHDPAIIPDMKAQLKQAEESLEHAPVKTPAETRHDLQTILATFSLAMQKAEKSTASSSVADFAVANFTIADLTSLYAALPVLDSRVASALAANRLVEQNKAQLWATALTILCWGSLIIAAALAAGIYLVLRDRNSAPMRALAQSVKNMARGDMRTPIWGLERQDIIGELARSVDQARFHFSQLPDMSLLSEQGPVRIRFEGNTRSLFEAMMRVISRDSEAVHEQANNLTEAVIKQQEALTHVIERVEAVLQNVEKRAVSGDQQVRQALSGMLHSAESLKNAQEHAADQLNRIIPFLQERSQGLSEITQITGKQVAQVLQSLALTERGLRTSSEQSEEAIRKFSSTADTLGERMFGAVNLLQASGKVLAETTEAARSRFDDAIERISSAILNPPQPHFDPALPDRLENAATALAAAQAKLETLVAEQTQATRAQIDLLAAQSGGLLLEVSTSSQTMATAADRLREEQEKLAEIVAKAVAQSERGAYEKAGEVTKMLVTLTEGFASVEHGINMLQSHISDLQAEAAKPRAVSEPDEQMRDHWYQMAAQIEASRSNLAEVIQQQSERLEAQIEHIASKPVADAAEQDFVRDTQAQLEQQTLILNELVSTLGILDEHMQELRGQVGPRQKAG